jgi:hypothetical protein
MSALGATTHDLAVPNDGVDTRAERDHDVIN